MANIAKKFIQKSRDHLLRDIIHANSKTLNEIGNLERKIGEVEKNLHNTHLEINHNQKQFLEDLDKRVKNSGTLVLSETEMLTKIFSGLKMFLDPRDIAVASHIALDTIWEHQITTAWIATVQKHDTVLDIGSNFGYFGALAAQLTDKKKSKVVHFEANPHLIPYIRKTLAINWLNEQSVVENLAVGDKDGKLTLNLLKDYVGSSSVLPLEHTATYMKDKMHLEKAEAITVKATSIDNYCKAHEIKTVDLIKMDIEGFEDKAYAGMRKVVQASPSLTLFIEFTKDSYANPKAFYEQMLKDFGHVYTIDDEGYIVKAKNSSYEAIIGDADDWVMPIFSKKANIATR